MSGQGRTACVGSPAEMWYTHEFKSLLGKMAVLYNTRIVRGVCGTLCVSRLDIGIDVDTALLALM